ncbi:MAG: nicotinate-nucleotide adenylyltransferase [Snowella sp.]|nr:nicotinate-nucleotide adenylyltransferase [Snowella sp.]
MKIALFGTSADPPTAAHQSILQWLSEHYDQVAVWASDNPFKDRQTALEHRMAMLELLIGSLNLFHSNVRVYRELSDRRSLNSLEKAQQIWGKDADYSLVIGSDLVPQIPRWYRVQDLFQSVNLLIIPRPGHPLNKDDLQQLQTLGATYHIAQMEAPEISSTIYRQTKDKTVIPVPVKEYICQQKLYVF